ncbi:hypothetical protein HPB50_021002 [Hyalomma asiaticum]|uniref:Uncharacterized protein n=1 Tax=Hyalomma asiaticum TaxID=266040 RepID=A0ACB7T3I9_HYAAI|nr:hypothetical protein HPB50_021002 [Hyalomma asiaticum]
MRSCGRTVASENGRRVETTISPQDLGGHERVYQESASREFNAAGAAFSSNILWRSPFLSLFAKLGMRKRCHQLGFPGIRKELKNELRKVLRR